MKACHSHVLESDRNRDRVHSILILMPVFNDWESAGMLIGKIDAALAPHALSASIVIVNDGSTLPPSINPPQFQNLQAVKAVSVLHLKRNLGHQRAIVVGLSYIESQYSNNFPVVVMDADGEDDPKFIIWLLEKYQNETSQQIVFARRTKRSEGVTFRLFYWIYRFLFRFLTGREIRFGNFSLIPQPLLPQLLVVSEIWNHYACGIEKSRLPFAEINVPRARRLSGKSKMNFVSLVLHGLSGISVYGDIVGARLLILFAMSACICFVAIVIVFFVRFGTSLAAPGWATSAVGILLIIILQNILLSIIFSFITLASRNNNHFIPWRDCPIFISHVEQIVKP